MSRRDQVLVSTDWVADRAADPAVRLVEVDEDTAAHVRGHVPGAVAWHWWDDLHHPLRRDLVGAEGLRALLGRSGVGPRTEVVLYGGNDNWFAAYAYWVLLHRGFDRVRLMDGGRRKWEVEGRPQEDRPPARAPADPGPLGDPRPELRAFRDDVLAAIGAPGVALVDVRSPAEFAGEMPAPAHLPREHARVAGHIPGAVNVPWARAVAGDGSFLPDAELAALYRGAGVDPGADVVTYCRVGERSSHTWFVLHELLGYARVRNYDGSWTEWGSLVGVPVERSQPGR